MANNLFDLSGKVALVTASSRGIGRGIAERMAEAGAKVVISSRKADACAAVVDDFTKRGLTAISVPCNVSAKEELQNLADKTLQKWGRIDVLVCNAGINPVYGSLSEITDAAFDKIMATNVRSTLWLCNMVIPQMAQRKDGAVILISSVAGLKGNKVIGTYGISKAAEMQLTRNLAVEWGKQNIRVNAIAPGIIRTDFAKALYENPEILKRVQAQAPLGRIGEVDEIAGIAVMLASKAGAFMTGQVIVADGGVTIGDAV